MPAKRINPRLAKIHCSFDVKELSDLLCAHKRTEQNWISAGLPTVEGTRPMLILGSEFQNWWAKRRKAAKRPLQPGQLYCLKCRAGRAPANRATEYIPVNAVTGNPKGACEACGTMMYRRVRLADIETETHDLAAPNKKPPSSIVEQKQLSQIMTILTKAEQWLSTTQQTLKSSVNTSTI